MLRQDREGLTALGWACLRGRVQAAQCLLDRGANVNHVDKTGRTPLDLAAFQGNPNLVQVCIVSVMRNEVEVFIDVYF